MFGNCNHCCLCCGHPCTMLGVSLSISCKNKIQCVCVEKKKIAYIRRQIGGTLQAQKNGETEADQMERPGSYRSQLKRSH